MQYAVSTILESAKHADRALAEPTSDFKDCDIPFTLWYDEVMICHAVEISFEILIDGVVHSMLPGDMMWIPAGTTLAWRSKGTSTAFFAVTPADWAKRKPGS